MKPVTCALFAVALGVAGTVTNAERATSSQAPRMAAAHPSSALPEVATAAAQTALVKQYCAGCHSDRGKAGGLTLASFDAAAIAGDPVVAEKMIRKLRAGMMPPAGARRPEAAVLTGLAEAFETRIDRAAALNPNPGARPSQRMNRAEY